jgi:hypothetical protein
VLHDHWLFILLTVVVLFFVLVRNVTDATTGFITQFKLNGAKVAQVVDGNGPPITVGTAKATNRDSPTLVAGVPWEELLPTVAAGGEITFNVVTANANLSVVFGLLGTKTSFSVARSDGHAFTGNVLVTGMKPGSPMEDTETTDITVICTGAVAYG